jgi:hypothetical protein
MKIELNKTIEEMAEEGYKPVLNPGIVAINEMTPEILKEDEKCLWDLMINVLKQTYRENPLVDKIETMVIRNDGITNYNLTGDKMKLGVPKYTIKTGFLKSKNVSIHPVMFYIKD